VERVKARCRKTARLTAIYGSLSTLGTRHRENRSMAGIDIESAHQATLSEWGTVAFTQMPLRDGAGRRPMLPWAFLVAIAVHIAIFVALQESTSRRVENEDEPISISLIEAAPMPPAVLELPRAPPQEIERPVRSVRHPVPIYVPAAPVAAVPTDEPVQTIHLYRADGTLDIPDDLARQIHNAKTSRAIDAPPVADNTIMVHVRPLKIRPNHFDMAWKGSHADNELDQFVKDHLIKQTDAMRLPWGTQIECGWFVIVVACGWGPPPVWHAPTTWKPATSLDEY
jgi:hypothetical protein